MHLFLLVLIIAFFPAQASAYIDPGAGNMVLQTIVAILAAGAVAIKMFWLRIVNFFRLIFGKSKNNDTPKGSNNT